jgi:hypothetical protein
MAKKEIEQPSTRSKEFLSGQRPLLLSDLTDEEKGKAFDAVSAHTMRTRAALTQLATHQNHENKEVASKGKRAQRALDEGAVNKPYNHEDAINSHIEHFERSASTLRREGESIHGGNFYTEHADPIHALVEGRGISAATGFEATAKLSNKNRPGNEKVALSSLLNAHENGKVSFTPELVKKVNAVSDHPIPAEHIGKEIPFSQVHPKVAAALSHPDVRETATKNSSNVDYSGIAKGGMRLNIAAAHGVLQTGTGNDPFKNPKFASYAAAHAEAPRKGSNEELEYKMRQSHISDAVTGKIGKGQLALDLTGLQHLDSGHFSNMATTPIDLHHRRMAYTQPVNTKTQAPYSAAGDLPMTAKGNIAKGDTKITAAGVEHAVLQDSVHQAAKRVQEKYDLPFSVPSRLMNEGSWASTRHTTGDSEVNTAKKEADSAHSDALKQQADRNAHRGQMELF